MTKQCLSLAFTSALASSECIKPGGYGRALSTLSPDQLLLSGAVYDSLTQRGIANADVEVLADSSRRLSQTVTDRWGRFKLVVPIVQRTYRVSAQRAGYATVCQRADTTSANVLTFAYIALVHEINASAPDPCPRITATRQSLPRAAASGCHLAKRSD